MTAQSKAPSCIVVPSVGAEIEIILQEGEILFGPAIQASQRQPAKIISSQTPKEATFASKLLGFLRHTRDCYLARDHARRDCHDTCLSLPSEIMMNRTQYTPLEKPLIKYLSAAFATSLVFGAGCSNMVTSATGGNSFAQGAAITGKLHGGNQPVGFATVQIYTIGQSGVGSAGTLLATTTTDASGNFSFNKQASGTFPNTGNSYSCPATGAGQPADRILYIVSHGGNTTGSGGSGINNSAAVFLAPLGLCASVTNSQFVDISEVTTAATVAALSQFINPQTEMIGNDGIGVAYGAIIHAVQTIPNLVNLATGLSNTSVPLSGAAGGANVAGVTVTATPQAAKLNTIANILSACINQVSASGSNCSTLFSAATPPVASRTSQPGTTFPAATDTLQAALYMFLNPTDGSTSNRTALFNLSPAVGAPYQPTISAVPTDWTVAISYSTTNTCTGSTQFFSNPFSIGITVNGDVWIANRGISNSALVELSASGVPSACVALGGNGYGDVIDSAGNVWFVDAANNVIDRYVPSTGATRTYNTTGQPLAIAADGSGNIFYTTISGSTGSVYKIVNGATIDGVNPPLLISNVAGPYPATLFPDAVSNIWVSSGSNFVTQLNPAAGGANFVGGYSSTQFTVTGPTFGITVGPNNRVFVTSQDSGSTVTVLTPSGSTYAVASGFPTAANAAGLTKGTNIWLDGATSSWIGNAYAEINSSQFALSVVAVDGSSITPDGKQNGGYQKSNTFYNVVRAVAVDQAGNVWVTNDANPNSVTQLVGAAVPIFQSYANGLQNGRFQTIP